jgi:hypothetical protein
VTLESEFSIISEKKPSMKVKETSENKEEKLYPVVYFAFLVI